MVKQVSKGFWMRVYPIDPATSLPVTFRFCSMNNRAAVNVIPGDTWYPYIESYPTTEISVFEGIFEGKAESSIKGIELTADNAIVRSFPNYVWDGAKIEVFKGNSNFASFGDLSVIFTGVIETAPEVNGNVCKIEATDRSSLLDIEIFRATYTGGGGIEGTVEMTGKAKPFVLGYPLNIEPEILNPGYLVFQYHGYGTAIGVQKLFENGIQFGAAASVYPWQGSAAATYAGLIALTIAAGQWVDCPSIGCFRLGGEPKTGGVITCDVQGHVDGVLIRNINAVINWLVVASGQSATVFDAGSLTSLNNLYSNTYNQTIDDYFTGTANLKELIEQYLTPIGAYPFFNSSGFMRFGLVRITTPTFYLRSDGRTTPIVDTVTSMPVSAPYKQLRIGADKNFRVQGSGEISDALYQQYYALNIELDNLANDYYSAASDNTLTVDEKIRIVIPGDARLESAYTDIRARGVALGLATTNLDNARTAYINARNAISPSWNNTSANSTISPSFRNLITTYSNELVKLNKAISEADAQRADYANVTSLPAAIQGTNMQAGGFIDTGFVKYTGGATVQSLKPAEAGADVTGTHTSLNTSNVGGMTSTAVVVTLAQAQADVISIMADVNEVFRNILPSTFDQLGEQWFLGYTGDPATRTPLAATGIYSFPTVSADIGRVLRISQTATIATVDVGLIPAMRIFPGRKYRIKARFRQQGGIATTASVQILAQPLDVSYASVSGSDVVSQAITTGGGWYTVELNWDPTTAIAAGGMWMRPDFRFINPTANTCVVDVQYIKTEDVTDYKDAYALATTANNTATTASNSAAAAVSASSLAVRAGKRGFVRNSDFADYPSGAALTAPPEWTVWNAGPVLQRTTAYTTSPYSLQISRAASGQAGVLQEIRSSAGLERIWKAGDWVVIECEFLLETGTLAGAGAYLSIRNSSNVEIDTTKGINFSTDADAQGNYNGAGVAGNEYVYTKMVQIPANGYWGAIYFMAGWTVYGSISVASSFKVRQLNVRFATEHEIAIGNADTGMRAAVNILQGVMADERGKSAAYWKLDLNTSGAAAFITASASTTIAAQYPLNVVVSDPALVVYDSARRSVYRNVPGGTAWTSSFYSRGSYTSNAYVEFSADRLAECMIGLNTDPTTDSNYTSIDFAIQLANDGNVYIYESGTSQATAFAWAYQSSDRMSIEYTGTTVTYRVNGRVLRTATTTAGQTFFLDASFGTGVTSNVRNIVFAPIGDVRASTVAIGAYEFSVYNPVGANWVKALSIRDGNAYFTGKVYAANLQVGELSRNLLYNNGGQLTAGPASSGLPTARDVNNSDAVDGWRIIQYAGGVANGCRAEANYYSLRAGNANSLVIYNPTHSASTGIGIGSIAMPVVPGRQYVVKCSSVEYGDVSGNGIYFRVLWSPSLTSNGRNALGEGNPGVSTTDVAAAAPGGNAYYQVVTCPAGCYWAEIHLYNWINGSSYYLFTNVSFTEILEGGEIRANTIIASKFLTDQGVDLAAIVNGALNTASLSSSGTTNMVVTASSPNTGGPNGNGYYNLAMTGNVTVVNTGDSVFYNFQYVCTAGSARGSVRAYYSTDNGGSWNEIARMPVAGSTIPAGTQNLSGELIGLAAGTTVRLLLLAQQGAAQSLGDGTAGTNCTITSAYALVRKFFSK